MFLFWTLSFEKTLFKQNNHFKLSLGLRLFETLLSLDLLHWHWALSSNVKQVLELGIFVLRVVQLISFLSYNVHLEAQIFRRVFFAAHTDELLIRNDRFWVAKHLSSLGHLSRLVYVKPFFFRQPVHWLAKQPHTLTQAFRFEQACSCS